MANTWIRDTIMITNYQIEIGRYENAQKTVKTLRKYFLKHKRRFINIIKGKTDKNDHMQRPHIRFNGDTLEEIDQFWNHAQNDALGYALWMVFRLVNLDRYEFEPCDYNIFALFPFYFEAISFWEDKDSGHWEEEPKIESSSIGVVVAGLMEMKQYIKTHRNQCLKNKNNPDFIFTDNAVTGKVTITLLDTLIRKGKMQLDGFLPDESPGQRDADAALLFLIYPLEVVSKRQETMIIELILSRLKGEYGIKRYIGDSYFCADYEPAETGPVKGKKQKQRDRQFKISTEAQWCIFDPVLSIIYGKRYLSSKSRTSKGEKEYLKYQTHHFNRSLLQLTSDFKCPECYYLKDF